MGSTRRPSGRLLYLVTEDWYFVSHRIALARAARDAGWEVHVACRVREHGGPIRSEGFVLHPLSWRRGSLNPIRELAAVAEIFRLYGRVRPALVHHVAMKPVIYGSLAARLLRIPAVVNAMAGMGFAFTGESLKSRALRAIATRAFRLLLGGRGRRLVVQNVDDAALFRDHRLLAPDRIAIIPGSGVDIVRFQPMPEPETGPAVAILVARMLWDKGIGETVEAARLLKKEGVPVEVHLVGPPDPENPAAIPEATLEAWNAEGVVRWRGASRDIPAVWRAGHIALLPSYREGMPRSLLEAAACGRPIVTTDVIGCRALVRHEVDGLLVPKGDARALADAIRRLALDPELRRRLGAAARRRVESEFSDAVILGRFLSLYAEVVAERDGTAAGQDGRSIDTAGQAPTDS